MRDETKTKAQLIAEIELVRQRVAKMEAMESRQKRVEEELRESDEKFRSFMETASDLMHISDRKARFTYVNEAMAKNLGYSKEELLGRHASMLLTNKDRGKKFERIQQQLIAAGELTYERTWLTKGGGKIHGELKLVAIYDGNDHYLEARGVFRDITARKRAEEALREQAARNELILETAMDGFWVADITGKILKTNQAACRILGLSQEELIGMNIRDIDAVRSSRQMDSHAQGLMKKGGDLYETKFRLQDGHTVDVRVSTNFVESGVEKFLFSFFQDISNSKQAYRALREREEELQTKTDNLEEVNTALKVLLRRIDEDKQQLEEKVLINVKVLVVPYLEKLMKTAKDERQKAYLVTLAANLNDIVSPLARKLSSVYLNFTPAEIQIANFIKNGKTTKEIAELLNLSSETVNSHRKNIRNKMGINNKRANLRIYLLSFD